MPKCRFFFFFWWERVVWYLFCLFSELPVSWFVSNNNLEKFSVTIASNTFFLSFSFFLLMVFLLCIFYSICSCPTVFGYSISSFYLFALCLSVFVISMDISTCSEIFFHSHFQFTAETIKGILSFCYSRFDLYHSLFIIS